MKPLNRKTNLEQVLTAVREAIINGTFQSGDQLKQSEIADDLGVSQGPVREALARLVEEGLVVDIPYKGVFVRELTLDDVNEIYEFRGALEKLSAHLATEKLRQQNIQEDLKQLVDHIVRAAESGDPKLAMNSDLGFHRKLVELGQNSRVIKAWDSLLAQARSILLNLYSIPDKDLMLSLAKGHYRLLDSLIKGNELQINIAITEHMKNAQNKLHEHWQEVSSKDYIESLS